jgi:hypothetical protein
LAKFINRIQKDGSSVKPDTDLSEDEEVSHITERGPRIDIQDPIEVKERTIFFTKEEQPKTQTEIVQEKAQALRDQAETTNQYQKFVNVVLQERMGDLKKVLDKQKRFSEELSCFQDTPKTRQELEKINTKYINEAETKSLINNLESEYQKTKEQLDYEVAKVEKTKGELETKKQQIEALKEEMKFIVKKGKKAEKIDDPVLTLKHELKKLGVSDDSGKITDALKLLSQKLNQK